MESSGVPRACDAPVTSLVTTARHAAIFCFIRVASSNSSKSFSRRMTGASHETPAHLAGPHAAVDVQHVLGRDAPTGVCAGADERARMLGEEPIGHALAEAVELDTVDDAAVFDTVGAPAQDAGLLVSRKSGSRT
jgi:hypothetical protein